jgi:hypothetical protein
MVCPYMQLGRVLSFKCKQDLENYEIAKADVIPLGFDSYGGMLKPCSRS